MPMYHFLCFGTELALTEHMVSPCPDDKFSLHVVVGRHKKDEVSIGDHLVFLEHCKSHRPTFVIQGRKQIVEREYVQKQEEWADYVYVNLAIGMPHQSELQQTTLARCKIHHDAAACFLTVARKLLRLSRCVLSANINARDGLLAEFKSFSPALADFLQTNEITSVLDQELAVLSCDTKSLLEYVCKERCKPKLQVVLELVAKL